MHKLSSPSIMWFMLLLLYGVGTSPAHAEIEDEVFYFVIPDRFDNKKRANDTGGIPGGKQEHGFDPTDSRYYHGGDLAGLTKQLLYIKRLGVTSIWISPPFKNKPVSGNSAAYHGYWAVDYTQIDPHWGSNKELQKFIKRAHRYRMKVYFDVVINHTADVIKYEECHTAEGDLLEGLSQCPYRSIEASLENPYSPFIPNGEESIKSPAWLNDTAYYNNQGDSTFSGESSVYGDFLGLDDLDTANPVVVEGMIALAKRWISEFDIDGMRVDTVKHVDMSLWQEWVPAVQQHAASLGKSEFFIFGEVFDGFPANAAKFTKEGKFPSVLDFAMYYAIKDMVADSQGTDRMAWVLSQDDHYTDADSDANQLMTFVSNHDVGRIGHFIESIPGRSEEEKLARAKLAQSMLYFTRGVPVMYYGDEQGFTGDGGDAEAREDMFASQVAEYNDNNLIGTDATTADRNFDARHPIFRHIRHLSLIRRAFPGLRNGFPIVHHSQATPGIFAMSRIDPQSHKEMLVLFNTSTTTQEVELDVMADTYYEAFPRIRFGRSDDVYPDDSKLRISLAPLSTKVFASRNALPLPSTVPEISFSSLVEGDKVSGLVEVATLLSGSDIDASPLHRVHFEVSVNGGEFTSLGTDYNADYRVFFNTANYADGTSFVFRATVDNYGQQRNSTQVQVEKGRQPGLQIYFKKPEGWNAPNIYWWNADPQPGVDWPGTAMMHIAGNWYSFQFEEGVSRANLIFNDGSTQTSDLYREDNGCYADGQWTDSCILPGLTVRFEKPQHWGDNVNIYWFNTPGQDDAIWPGVPMTLLDNGFYEFQFDADVRMANLVFNDGAGNQSSDLYRQGDGCYQEEQWRDMCDVDTNEKLGMTVYFRRPLDWNVPNIHYWYPDGGTSWPGEEMDAMGDDWYKLQLPEGVTAANMVINDKTDGTNGHQTADLYREGDGCYDLTTDTWSATCGIPGYNVYFKKPQSWSSANAYFWNTEPVNAGNVSWPGEAMTMLDDTWYTYQLPNGVRGSNIIFNNGGAPQTADLYRYGDGCYTLDSGWTDGCDLPPEPITVYFYKPAGWGDDVNIYFWNTDGSPSWPGVPMQSMGDNWFSFTFNADAGQPNLIFNDGQGNQTQDLLNVVGGCYGEFGDFWRKSCLLPNTRDIEIQNRAAHWLSRDVIAWQLADSRATQFRLYHASNATIKVEDGQVTGADGYVNLQFMRNLPANLQDQSPHLAAWNGFALDGSNAEALIKTQLVVVAMDDANNLMQATRVQIARVLDDLYDYKGALGVNYSSGVPTISLWAPTAQSVELVRYDALGNEVGRSAPTSSEQGAYHFAGRADWDKQYYRFALTVYHPLSDHIESYEVTDPYSVSLSQNSRFSQILDISNDPALMPDGWQSLTKSLPEFQDISLYEGHIRDFSQNDSSVPEALRGKYMAFTLNGVDGAPLSNGMAHLRALQQAGLTHFHLLPVFDISSINEDPAEQIDVSDSFADLCAISQVHAVQSRCSTHGDMPIDAVLTELTESDNATAEVQAIVTEMVNRDSFNWGYDPFHFNAPEGSYASSPNGATRILEFREMVKALDEIGLNMVMDVVYNHTSASGLWDNAVLDKVVPGYYHRLNPISGAVENSTCCDNTATEHKMMERLMVDSLVLWAREFKIDSFRFDLMGHIPKSAMVAAQTALSQLTLADDGVDGSNIYLYGEGWNFGEVANDQRFEQATQFNMAGTGIATFNDRIRSAIRGGNFTDSGRSQGWTSGNELFPNGYVTGGSLADQADRIRIGLAGNLQTFPFVDHSGSLNTGMGYAGVGYTLDPQESVNYVDKHDNETLWDNTQAKLPSSMSAEDRVRVHMLSNALINYGQGVPFYQMGTDLLRSKSLDRNSYNSGDWFNAIDFTATDNNWAKGLPPAQDNETRWETMADILDNGNIEVTSAHIGLAHNTFKDQLRVRYSSPLFRLNDAPQVIQRVSFGNTGPNQIPGLIAMAISDGICAGADLDPNYDGALILFNADDNELTFEGEGMTDMSLHPVLTNGVDEVVKQASTFGSRFIVPAHTAAVFVKTQVGSQGEFPCNEAAQNENRPESTIDFKSQQADKKSMFTLKAEQQRQLR
ncbi:pullulanase-type alpha-1,6-glucosidase [Alteromonas sp. ASW11-130]|uniref:pullulanase-type alpha-1,6-glucosidase n=1 Tax=Alteromonas sp. ASW11-130 TaxID=3015775 RepID=UPI0022418909|nr:pullulanase-type alpha-1,6-glucosidase [Alteromonas sp. ASW11-130]MCW8092652.1 pullulanase-type alpha-1,6-glucosidase [Alteromonas sp. ASW11-130]